MKRFALAALVAATAVVSVAPSAEGQTISWPNNDPPDLSFVLSQWTVTHNESSGFSFTSNNAIQAQGAAPKYMYFAARGDRIGTAHLDYPNSSLDICFQAPRSLARP